MVIPIRCRVNHNSISLALFPGYTPALCSSVFDIGGILKSKRCNHSQSDSQCERCSIFHCILFCLTLFRYRWGALWLGSCCSDWNDWNAMQSLPSDNAQIKMMYYFIWRPMLSLFTFISIYANAKTRTHIMISLHLCKQCYPVANIRSIIFRSLCTIFFFLSLPNTHTCTFDHMLNVHSRVYLSKLLDLKINQTCCKSLFHFNEILNENLNAEMNGKLIMYAVYSCAVCKCSWNVEWEEIKQ